MMYRLIFTSLFLCLLVGCDNNDSNTNDNIIQAEEKVRNDAISSNAGDAIWVEITVNNLPQTITYNKASTPVGNVEYRWSVTFDMNADGAIGVGDLVFELAHRKEAGVDEQSGSAGDFPAFLRAYESNDNTVQELSIYKQISGNVIKIAINKQDYPLLENIDATTMVYFESSMYDEQNSQTQFDYFPSFKTLASMPADKRFTDAANDSQFAMIDMLSLSIDF